MTGNEGEDSTDKAIKRHSAQDLREARYDEDREKEGREAELNKTRKNELGVRVYLPRLRTDTQVLQTLSSKHTPGRMRPQCTCHVYGQMHQRPGRPK